jgi:hypothetical protein
MTSAFNGATPSAKARSRTKITVQSIAPLNGKLYSSALDGHVTTCISSKETVSVRLHYGSRHIPKNRQRKRPGQNPPLPRPSPVHCHQRISKSPNSIHASQQRSKKRTCPPPLVARFAAHCPQKNYGLCNLEAAENWMEIMHACPRCGSLNTRRSKRKIFEKILAQLFVRPYRCKDCNNRFFNGMTKARLTSSNLRRVGI